MEDSSLQVVLYQARYSSAFTVTVAVGSDSDVAVGTMDVALKDHGNTMFRLHRLPLQQ